MRDYRISFFIRILRLTLGAFFIILGLTGIFREFSENMFSLQQGYTSLEVIFGIVEIFCGLLILTGFFAFRDSQPVYWGGFIALILWISRIVLSRFLWGMTFIVNDGIVISRLVDWLLILSCELIIGASLLVILKRYE